VEQVELGVVEMEEIMLLILQDCWSCKYWWWWWRCRRYTCTKFS
jgi:hypothetical protein